MQYKYVDYDTLPAHEVLIEYLVQSCAAYMLDNPMVPEFTYERLGRCLKKRWREIADCEEKKLVDKAYLNKTPFGYYISYPTRIVLLTKYAVSEYNKLPSNDFNHHIHSGPYSNPGVPRGPLNASSLDPDMKDEDAWRIAYGCGE